MSTDLLDLQRRMAAAVMEPLNRTEGMRTKRRDGVKSKTEASVFIKPSATLTSFERLEIYNRQYWFRLFDSFEEDFPGLRAVLGARRFERLMRAYITECPSTSYTLRDLGSKLMGWLERSSVFTEPYTALAEDVARLEWAHIEAYDGASYPTLTPEFLASITDQTCLGLQPHVRLLALSHPVDEFLIRLRQDEGSSNVSSNNATIARKEHTTRRRRNIRREQIFLAVHRQDFTVYYKRLQREEYQMLTALQAGYSLGEVFVKGFEHTALTEEEKPSFLQETFQQWTILGWLHSPDQNDYTPTPESHDNAIQAR